MGYNTVADHVASTAMGNNTIASGDYSTAMGINSIASGDYSVAAGHCLAADGDYSIALGHAVGNGEHSGCFIWGDDCPEECPNSSDGHYQLENNGDNQFWA